MVNGNKLGGVFNCISVLRNTMVTHEVHSCIVRDSYPCDYVDCANIMRHYELEGGVYIPGTAIHCYGSKTQ